MSWSKSPLAFKDIEQTFARALETPKGIKINCPSYGAAINLRSRFNYHRKMSRKQNAEIYPSGHYMHGHSLYDVLVLRVPHKFAPDAATLYIEHRSDENFDIEEIA